MGWLVVSVERRVAASVASHARCTRVCAHAHALVGA